MSDDRKSIPLVELLGDGISHEITREARRVLDVFSTAPNGKYKFVWEQHPIGGRAIDATGNPLPDETLVACKRSAAVLLGAVGDPKYSSPDTPVRPEQGLLKIRMELQLFTNLRPVFVYPTLIDSSPFKRSTIENTDMIIVRELTGGIYNNVHTLTEKDATDVMYYTVEEIERIIRVAAKLAQQRKKKLVSLDKCNVLACSRLWRSVCTRIMKDEFPDVEVEHLLIDAAAMHILKRPRDFDVIVTENLFGDILTDEAAALSSSLGMLGSASIGHPNTPGLYEPIHGSAPDIAGKGIANPIGTILAASMLLRYGLGLIEEANIVDQAVADVVKEGIVTGDVALPGAKKYSTTQVGIAVAHKVAAALHPIRPMTLPEKILCHQSVGLSKPEVKPGDVIVVKVARTLASEMTWVGMSETYNDIGKPNLWRKDRFFLAIDHTVDPINYHEEKQKLLIDAAEGFAKSIQLDDYFGPNESILHTEFYRQKAMPGTVIVGADSHSCSAGCLGNFAAGLGAADVVMPVVTGQTFFEVPETLLIKFVNDLPFGMTGKDVMLYIMQKLKRNTVAFERAVEFAGNIRSLSVDARFALSNMATEFGAIAGIFPSDEQTASFLAGRKKKATISTDDDNEWDYKNFRGDDAALYADAYDIDLSAVVPLIAKYPSPDNVYTIDDPEIDAIVPEVGRSIRKLDGVFIGACTTTEEELILAALVLDVCLASGLTPTAPGTRKVTPGSAIMKEKLERTGCLEIYRRAGYTIGAPGCSYCLGVGADVAPRNTVWLSSQNRNFRNRMGAGSIGNLASAATVAVSSFNMTITDPRPYLAKVDRKRLEFILERHPLPASVPIHEPSPLLETAESKAATTTPLPLATAIPTKTARFAQPISGRIQRFEDNIDTDAIIPGPLMLERPLKRLGTFSFKYVKPDFVDRVNAGQNIVVAGVGFGSGSSREEAVSCLRACGVQAVIAKSYAFIFGRNLLTLDLLGIVIKDERFYQLAQEDANITIDVTQRVVHIGGEHFSFTMSDIQQQIYERNGIIEMYKQSGKHLFQELAAYAKQREGGEGCGTSKSGCGTDSGKGKPKVAFPAGAAISW